MSEKPASGGKRRIDRILDPGFTRGLESLEMDEIRARRDLCRAERNYLSYLRRLLQGRRDILRDEQERRAGRGRQGSVVERLTAVLADSPRGASRGEAVVVSMPEEEIALARRRVERLLSDVSLSNLEALSDDALESAISKVEAEEGSISELRSRALAALDRFQDEIKRRYRAQLRRLRA